MARKLNLLLYEIAESPRTAMMSKEALEGLFQSEIAWIERAYGKPAIPRPGKPTDNSYIESFNGKFRAECRHAHWFKSLDDAHIKREIGLDTIILFYNAHLSMLLK